MAAAPARNPPPPPRRGSRHERDAEHPSPCPAPPPARFSQTPFPGCSAGLLRDRQVSRVGQCRRTGSLRSHACPAVSSLVGLASALLGRDSTLQAQHLPQHMPVCPGWAGAPITQLVGLPCPLSLSPESGSEGRAMLKSPQDPPRHMTRAPLGAETRPGSTKWLGHTAGHAPRASGSEGSSRAHYPRHAAPGSPAWRLWAPLT